MTRTADSASARRPLRGAAVVTALALAIGLAWSPASHAKKGGGKKFEETKVVNAAIPPAPASGAATALTSELKVPKKFKGKVVGDLNVTGVQTTGTAADSANDLTARLTAPNGRTVLLFLAIGDQSIGPLTLDDDTSVSLCDTPPGSSCIHSNLSLLQPFAGTSNLLTTFAGTFSSGSLASFDGVKMRGTWTFTIVDTAEPALNSTLNQWGLRIKPAKPVAE